MQKNTRLVENSSHTVTKMAKENLEIEVTIPQGVTVSQDGRVLTVKGEKGEVSREFRSKRVVNEIKDGHVLVVAKNPTQREKMLVKTFVAHLQNLFRGVMEGHTYKLKICSGHFPMTVTLKGDIFEVKNFIGEAVPRRMQVKTGADVKIDGDLITVTGIDKERVAQVAAQIEKLTKRPGFDTRIFQDGIYLTEKDGKKI